MAFMVQSDPKHIADLDVLRGLAIILVVAFHAQEFLVPGFALYAPPVNGFVWTPGDAGWQRFLWNLTPAAIGWAGVDLFLLLSGFLIHWSSLKRGPLLSWSDFYERRFWRIYPAYLVALVAFLTLLGPFGKWDVLAHVFLVHNYHPDTFYSINGSFWSLALEVQMYLLYPLLLKMNSGRGFFRSVMIVGSISLLSLFVERIFGPFGPVFSSSLLRLWVIWVVGAWIAERHHAGRPIFRHHLLLGTALLVLLPVLNLCVLRPFLLRYALLLLFAIMLEYVLNWGLRSDHGGCKSGIQKKVLTVLAFTGACSYSMYLVHQPILRWFVQFTKRAWGPEAPWIGVLPVLLLITGLSYCLYRVVELPGMRMGRRSVLRTTRSS